MVATALEAVSDLPEGASSRAAKGDQHGNLVFSRSTRDFNPLAAMAGRVTIAEVEELVEPGDIDPDAVHLPGISIQQVVAPTSRRTTLCCSPRTIR
ncbi:hypothetical protein GCM10023335_02590 [Streptomyces siamensis]|uniref:Uncharacterized protein n=1 Tax=Streptomyces siamensis TaxID=1274986 RepID=A0ABP9IC13_9ACTN